jgi:hypothetical protein
MAAQLSIRAICERALRRIGSFALRDSEADPEEMAEAQHWLDLVVSHMAGTKRPLWLVPATLSLTLTADTESYDLSDITGYPADGVLFPIQAWLRDSSGMDTPVELIRRKEYENIADKDQAGETRVAHIDRLKGRQIYVHPLVATTGYTLRILAQTYSPTYNPEDDAGAEVAHGFTQEWQLWMITALAAEIGDGPVRRLPGPEVTALRNRAAALLVELGESNRESVSKPRRTAAWGE